MAEAYAICSSVTIHNPSFVFRIFELIRYQFHTDVVLDEKPKVTLCVFIHCFLCWMWKCTSPAQFDPVISQNVWTQCHGLSPEITEGCNREEKLSNALLQKLAKVCPEIPQISGCKHPNDGFQTDCACSAWKRNSQWGNSHTQMVQLHQSVLPL